MIREHRGGVGLGRGRRSHRRVPAAGQYGRDSQKKKLLPHTYSNEDRGGALQAGS